VAGSDDIVLVFNFRSYKTFNRITQHCMEISDIVYLAFSTIMVVVILHVGVFWVSRLIQPPKPKIVYVDRAPPIIPEVVSAPILPTPPPPVSPPPQSQPSMAREMPQTMSVPTYDMPPPIVQSNKPQGMAASPVYDMPQPNKPNAAGLPPPIETRDVDRVGFSGGKAAPPQ
jgi:hypothetical protein